MLITKSLPSILRVKSPHLGRLLIPNEHSNIQGMIDAGIPWAADNGAFSGFDARRFMAMLERLRGLPNCKFVVVPDVVADATSTILTFLDWEETLRSYGLPLALVGQDGLEKLAIPWSKFNAFFIGGSTEWKLGPAAAEIAREAKARGKWVHMGRVNSYKRTMYAASIGCDSVDGSGLARFQDKNLHLALRAAHEVNGGGQIAWHQYD